MYKVHDSVQLPIGRGMGDNLPLPGYSDDMLGRVVLDFLDYSKKYYKMVYKKLGSVEVRLARPDNANEFGTVKIVEATGKTKALKKCGDQELTITAYYFVLPVSAFGTKGFECKNTDLINCHKDPKAKDFALNTSNLKRDIERLLRRRFRYTEKMQLQSSNKQQRIEIGWDGKDPGKVVCSKP